MKARAAGLVLGLSCLVPCFAQPAKPAGAPEPQTAAEAVVQQLFGKDGKDWSKYLVDTSYASVSAFGLLGIPGESVATVENVRDFVLAGKGLGSNNSAFGFAVTPARTSFLAMDLQSYAGNNLDRLLGSTSFGYAQGPASIGNINYQRQAFSVETNYFFHREHDPLVATWDKYKAGQCDVFGKPAAPAVDPSKPVPRVEGPAETPGAGSAEMLAAAKAAAEKCRTDAIAALPWNRSQLSASYATGNIRSEDGTVSRQSLGRSFALGLIYGFEHSDYLKDKAAAYLTLRRSDDEPVLDTLASGATVHKSTSLVVFKLAAGSKSFRVNAEVSNAEDTDVTATQFTFKQALGFDYRLGEALWLTFRAGKQRKFDGSGDETTSLISVSYSPSALLK